MKTEYNIFVDGEILTQMRFSNITDMMVILEQIALDFPNEMVLAIENKKEGRM